MSPSHHRSRLPWVAAVMGTALTLTAWQFVLRGENQAIQAHFEARALERSLAIRRQLAVDVSAVESLAAVLDASEELTREEFKIATAHLLERHLSLRAMGWNPRVLREERAAYEAGGEVGTGGHPITERSPGGTMISAGVRPAYYVVKFIEPELDNEAAIGFDVGSEPRRRAALERAAATGELSFSAGIELVQAHPDEIGFLAFWPRYRDGQILDFAVGVFQVKDVVKEAMAGFDDDTMEIRVEDVTDPGTPSLLYASDAGGNVPASEANIPVFSVAGRTIEQGGRVWQVGFQVTDAEFASMRTRFPLATLLVGLIVTIVWTSYLQVLLGRTRRIEELAAERAAEIARREQAEAERHGLDAQLQQAQKLESLGLLAGNIAHDFNNLLTSVLGNADLALLQLSSESPGRDELEQVRLAATRAAELTRQMLVYAGQAHFTPQLVNLSRVVEEMVHLLKTAISKKTTLSCELAPDLPPIEGDPTQIRQIVMNLITNASDALAGETGMIRVRTALGDADRTVSAASLGEELPPPERCVVLEISDNGSGMDEATQGRIFDPFFTTSFDGHGLGLAAVLGIVRSHHGAIRVDSESGEGTTFTVLFPTTETVTSPVAREPDRQAGPASFAGTVLVVDDEEPIRRLAVRLVGRLGFSVRTASDGVEAVEAFGRHADEIVAVVLDMTMPHMSGAEVFRAIRKIRPDVKVLFSSGYDREQSLEDLAGERAIGFLQKPYRAQQLSDALHELLDP